MDVVTYTTTRTYPLRLETEVGKPTGEYPLPHVPCIQIDNNR